MASSVALAAKRKTEFPSTVELPANKSLVVESRLLVLASGPKETSHQVLTIFVHFVLRPKNAGILRHRGTARLEWSEADSSLAARGPKGSELRTIRGVHPFGGSRYQG